MEREIDDDKFDALFSALFEERHVESETAFYNEEFENAYVKYPLLARLADRLDDLVLDLREGGTNEDEINGIIQCRAVACIAIGAYAASEVSDSL